MITLKINPLFKNALRPLESDEYDRLSKSIESEGCREALHTWKGYIIAGHNRYQICHETGQSFKVVNRDNDFEDETAVLIWILDDALGRRNLNFEDRKRYIGELYNLTKQQDSDRAERLTDKMSVRGDTSENIGLQFGVSGKTVRRYGSEAERQKVLEQLKIEVQKKAVKEGRDEDEDWMQEQMNEASAEMGFVDETDEYAQEIPDDDLSQVGPTEEQIAERKAANPKRGPKPKKVDQIKREALNIYESALNKIQGQRLDVLFDGLPLPDFAKLHSGIEKARSTVPKPKKKFGR